MEALKPEQRLYTKEEYLDKLPNSLHKLEFIDGEIRMMAGGTELDVSIPMSIFYEGFTEPEGTRS